MSRQIELQHLVAKAPPRELLALLSQDLSQEELCEEGIQEYVRCQSYCSLRRLFRAKLVGGLVLCVFALVAVARSATSWAWHAKEMLAGGAKVQLASMELREDCHTVQPSDRCYDDVVWAMRNRDDHPEWYIGLDNCSGFEDYQAFFHTQVLNSGARRCPRPCEPTDSTAKEKCKAAEKSKDSCHTAVPGDDCYAHVIHTREEALKYPAWYPGLAGDVSLLDIQYYLHKEHVCPHPCLNETLSAEDNITDCHTARPGDTCFADVLLAKSKFIKEHPSWYPGLTNASSTDEFQAFFHNQKHIDDEAEKKACPNPCNRTAVDAIKLRNTCKTAEIFDPCYESVLWGATKGLESHPEWYSGLDSSSTFEEFQLHVHKDNNTACHQLPCPCQRPVKGDACYETVDWVLSEGITNHSDDFRGLSKDSSFDEVQSHLHHLRTSACGRPCKTFDEDTRSPWKRF